MTRGPEGANAVHDARRKRRDQAVVRDVVAGCAEVLATLESWPADRVAAAVGSSTWTLTADAVRRVLADLQQGALNATTAQRWGAAMRWGGYPELGTTALDVVVDAGHEETILAVLERLDELGDIVDGEFRPGEIDQLLK